MVWEEMSFEEFQDGHDERSLAILNLCVTVMLPIKFWLNPTYGLGDVIWRISRWRPWRPSLISERYIFGNSKSLCYSNASHQVLAQSHLRFGRCRLKYFKMAPMAAILDIWTERFQQFWNSVTVILPMKFWLNPTFGLGGDVVWRTSRWPLAAILDIGMEQS